MSHEKKVIQTSSDLCKTDLLELIKGNIIALRIPNYFASELCDSISNKLLGKRYEYYKYAKEIVGRIGLSFSETKNDNINLKKYYNNSISNIVAIRDAFSPYLSPIDKLRLDLQEVWQEGAILGNNKEHRKTFVGLCRIIEPNKEVLPHQDILKWDTDNKNKFTDILTQLAVNIYLKIPEKGGELELWDLELSQKKYQLLAKGKYGIEYSLLPEPTNIIKPLLGELILFNSQKIHSIRQGNTSRITMSCFIGYKSDNNPLVYWS